MFRGGCSAGVVRGDVQLEACSNIEIFIDTLCDTQWTSQQMLGFAFMNCMILKKPHTKY